MALECELKYLDVSLAPLAEKLEQLGATSTGRYFESNAVFDRPDRSLKETGILLRLRQKQGNTVLTVKRPSSGAVDSALKVFEEIETGVEDAQGMREALEAIGFTLAFAYEKVREQWRYMDCIICLDRLPFGRFVEIEGTEEAVPVCAEALGLSGQRTTKATYHALNLEHRAQLGLPPDENFVFGDEERAAIFREIR